MKKIIKIAECLTMPSANMEYLTDYDYNPKTDIEVDAETRLLRWSEDAWRYKSEMIAKVSNYFGERREDE